MGLAIVKHAVLGTDYGSAVCTQTHPSGGPSDGASPEYSKSKTPFFGRICCRYRLSAVNRPVRLWQCWKKPAKTIISGLIRYNVTSSARSPLAFHRTTMPGNTPSCRWPFVNRPVAALRSVAWARFKFGRSRPAAFAAILELHGRETGQASLGKSPLPRSDMCDV